MLGVILLTVLLLAVMLLSFWWSIPLKVRLRWCPWLRKPAPAQEQGGPARG